MRRRDALLVLALLCAASVVPATALACQDAGPQVIDYACVDGGRGRAISCTTHADCPVGLSCRAEGWCQCEACAVDVCDGDAGCHCADGLADAGPGCRHVWRERRCLDWGEVIDAHWETVCPDAGTSDAGASELDARVGDPDAGRAMDAGGSAPASSGCSATVGTRSGAAPIVGVALAMFVLARRRRR